MTEGPKAAGALVWFERVGPALTAFRRKAGLSLADVAGRAKVGKSQLSKYETGKDLPRFESLARILDALDAEPLPFFYLVHMMSHDVLASERIQAEILLLQSHRRTGGPRLVESLLELHRAMLGCLDKSRD